MPDAASLQTSAPPPQPRSGRTVQGQAAGEIDVPVIEIAVSAPEQRYAEELTAMRQRDRQRATRFQGQVADAREGHTSVAAPGVADAPTAGNALAGEPAGQGGQAGPQKKYPSPGEHVGKVAMPPGALKDRSNFEKEWRDSDEYAAFMKDQIKGKEDRMKNEYDRFRSVDPYSPKTPTGAGSQAIAPTQSAAVGSPRGAEAEKSAPGDERAAETAQENEQERAQALAQEVELRRAQAASLRELRRMGGKGGRLSKDNKQKVAAQGRSVAGFISEEAQNSDWPYLLVLALSIINDLVDIFDVNLGLGLDQLFDFACLALMLGARLFIKQHEIGWMAWVASKLFTMLVEWIPVVGIIPTWTISALYVLSYARRQRKKRQRQGAMMEMEYAAMTEEEALASEEAEEEYRVAV